MKAGEPETSALSEILNHLQGDAAIQGTLEAAVASGGKVADSLQCVVNQLPTDYWDTWQPGFGRAAAQDADGGMRKMLDERGIRIQGMSDTDVDRLGNSIAAGLEQGTATQALAKEIIDDVGSQARAELIANTEYARSMTEASMQTYEENDVPMYAWLAEDDACEECVENEEAGPLSAGEEWPNGRAPVHPNCRCAIAPEMGIGVNESHELAVLKAGDDVIGDLSDNRSCSIVQPEMPDGSNYRGEHRPPSLTEGVKLSDMSDDEQAVYGVKPEGNVTVYRVAPKAEVNPGDWVSTDKTVSEKASRNSGMPVHTASVKADELVRGTTDDENEFGYIGEAKAATESLSDEHKLNVLKSKGPPPNLRPATDSLKSCKNCCLFNHPVCVKYGDWKVNPDETCDGWSLSIDDKE